MLTARRFAATVGVVPETVREWVRAGKLKPAGRTPGGHLRFRPDGDDLHTVVEGVRELRESAYRAKVEPSPTPPHAARQFQRLKAAAWPKETSVDKCS